MGGVNACVLVGSFFGEGGVLWVANANRWANTHGDRDVPGSYASEPARIHWDPGTLTWNTHAIGAISQTPVLEDKMSAVEKKKKILTTAEMAQKV